MALAKWTNGSTETLPPGTVSELQGAKGTVVIFDFKTDGPSVHQSTSSPAAYSK